MNTKTQKRENPKRAKTAKTAKTRKRENGENPKTAKTRKPENGESRKAVFASSNMLQSIKLAIKDARRWEQRETRKRENGQKPVFWFSRFLVFSFRWPHPSGQVAFFMCLGKRCRSDFWPRNDPHQSGQIRLMAEQRRVQLHPSGVRDTKFKTFLWVFNSAVFTLLAYFVFR